MSKTNLLDYIKYEVVFSMYYFKRELLILKISSKLFDKDRYTMVYKGSGLNGGDIGAILPFASLNTRKSISGPIVGYIYKEFYYNKNIISHRKNMKQFGKGVNVFIDRLTSELESYKLERIEQEMFNIVEIANEFKLEEENFINNDNRFDWGVLDYFYGLSEEAKLEIKEKLSL